MRNYLNNGSNRSRKRIERSSNFNPKVYKTITFTNNLNWWCKLWNIAVSVQDSFLNSGPHLREVLNMRAEDLPILFICSSEKNNGNNLPNLVNEFSQAIKDEGYDNLAIQPIKLPFRTCSQINLF